MALQVRQIMAARRAPLKPVPYRPFSDLTWEGWSEPANDGTKLMPKVCGITAPGQDAYMRRIDSDVDGRTYRLSFIGDRDPSETRDLGLFAKDSIIASHPWAVNKSRYDRYADAATFQVYHNISLPSVTTILSTSVEDDGALQAWRDGVGHDVADRIAAESAEKGTRVHQMVEDYVRYGAVRDEPIVTETGATKSQYEKEDWTIFHLLRQEIEQYDYFCASELTVFNLIHGYSGTIDLVGFRNGKLQVCDIKTYRRERKAEHLIKAQLQVTLYALALKESYDIVIEEAEIIYANGDTGVVVVPVNLEEFHDRAIDAVKKYYFLNP